jgi:hypothetical protein
MKPYPLVELNHLTVPFTDACEIEREPPLSKFAMCAECRYPAGFAQTRAQTSGMVRYAPNIMRKTGANPQRGGCEKIDGF